MADMLRAGAAWLAGQLKDSAGAEVRYYRGSNYGVVAATIGASRFETQGTSGVLEVWESRDFLIQAGALPFGEPLRHDRIVETVGGADVTYEVTSPRGVPVFHYGDAFRQMVRVHTVATAESSHATPTLRLRWWGAFAGSTITDEQIAAELASDLSGTLGMSRTITASAEYVYVVLPDAFGEPSFAVGGLASSAWETTGRTIAFAGQAALPYTIYRSTYPISGTITLTVS